MDDFVRIASLSDLPPGARLITRLPEGEQIALFNVDGEIYCIADVCTHDGGPVAEGPLDGCAIECPRHGARFDIGDGHVLAFPAVSPIDTYEVRTENGEIHVSQTPR